MNIIDEILRLKKEKNALILAHYYQNDEVQEIADFVGDSYYLSKIAKDSKENTLVFCGVDFMAESAKILSPDKKVLIPVKEAGCLMADMVNVEGLLKLKEKYKDAAIVTYINSSTEVKAISDVIVTSSNALKIVENLPQKNIIFAPDKNLGEYISEHVVDKNIILWQGYCPIHEKIKEKSIISFREEHPEAQVLVHPECSKRIRDLSHYIGSTSGIISKVKELSNKEILVVTEEGIFYELNKNNRDNKLYKTTEVMSCKDMKKINLESIYNCLLNEEFEIEIDEEIREKAYKALENMHELSQ